MIECLNFVSIYIRIKRNIYRLRNIQSKYILKIDKLKKNILDKHILNKIQKKIIKKNNIIRNEIKKNYKLMNFLKKNYKC